MENIYIMSGVRTAIGKYGGTPKRGPAPPKGGRGGDRGGKPRRIQIPGAEVWMGPRETRSGLSANMQGCYST